MTVKFYINPNFHNAFSWDGATGCRYGVSLLFPDTPKVVVVKAYHDIAGKRYGSDFCTAQLANHPNAVRIELDEANQKSMAEFMGVANQHITYASEWTPDMVKKGYQFLETYHSLGMNVATSAVIRYPVVCTREFQLDIPADEARKAFETLTPQEWEEKFGRGELIPNAVSDERYIPLWGEEDYPTIEDQDGTKPIAETDQVLVGVTKWEYGTEDRWLASRLTAGQWDAVGVIIPCSEKGHGVIGMIPMQGDVIEYGDGYGLVVCCWKPEDGVNIGAETKAAIKMEVRTNKSVHPDTRLLAMPITSYDPDIKPHESTVAIVMVKPDPKWESLEHGNGTEPFNWVIGGDNKYYQVIKQIVKYG